MDAEKAQKELIDATKRKVELQIQQQKILQKKDAHFQVEL